MARELQWSRATEHQFPGRSQQRVHLDWAGLLGQRENPSFAFSPSIRRTVWAAKNDVYQISGCGLTVEMFQVPQPTFSQ